ncbi:MULTISPECIES: GNAT family N-acetyltransferase [Actinosynnema]|uniref:GNAT family N-acetyltransferase n=1 Tax=Actinosynnema TaxID=40566 RepID=UPI0020A45599|nr:GNAT family N-acetyltransferase [Actinosynnema pretiosum]MCP2093255.1 Acetyltransferase (GNAT) family protein [Actinosynnema pretiosum]
MTGVLIRRAAPEDLGALLELVREFYLVDGHDYDRDALARALGPLLSGDEHGGAWLFDTGYAVLTWGYSLESGGREALLDEFYVRDRGRGTGSAVLAELVGVARDAGASRVFLETERPNGAARRFYRRNGFTQEDSTWLSLVL